ncbi:MAG: hypothetical protein AAB490_05410 [Patescibacteria group bacterium]
MRIIPKDPIPLLLILLGCLFAYSTGESYLNSATDPLYILARYRVPFLEIYISDRTIDVALFFSSIIMVILGLVWYIKQKPGKGSHEPKTESLSKPISNNTSYKTYGPFASIPFMLTFLFFLGIIVPLAVVFLFSYLSN